MRRARSTARYCPQQEDIAVELNRSRNCCCVVFFQTEFKLCRGVRPRVLGPGGFSLPLYSLLRIDASCFGCGQRQTWFL